MSSRATVLSSGSLWLLGRSTPLHPARYHRGRRLSLPSRFVIHLVSIIDCLCPRSAVGGPHVLLVAVTRAVDDFVFQAATCRIASNSFLVSSACMAFSSFSRQALCCWT
ncbi:hypothetical protein C8R45DRAFT_546519 [Mycena sanguinolenta]|nr:hypothetical protein C8R45DRAFT_546519 [Mycena sanguinolenta]